MLIVARAAQGLFGALLAPAAIAVIAVTFIDPVERAKAFGVFGAIGAAAGALGLLLGGFLTDYVSWRWPTSPSRSARRSGSPCSARWRPPPRPTTPRATRG